MAGRRGAGIVECRLGRAVQSTTCSCCAGIFGPRKWEQLVLRTGRDVLHPAPFRRLESVFRTELTTVAWLHPFRTGCGKVLRLRPALLAASVLTANLGCRKTQSRQRGCDGHNANSACLEFSVHRSFSRPTRTLNSRCHCWKELPADRATGHCCPASADRGPLRSATEVAQSCPSPRCPDTHRRLSGEAP